MAQALLDNLIGRGLNPRPPECGGRRTAATILRWLTPHGPIPAIPRRLLGAHEGADFSPWPIARQRRGSAVSGRTPLESTEIDYIGPSCCAELGDPQLTNRGLSMICRVNPLHDSCRATDRAPWRGVGALLFDGWAVVSGAYAGQADDWSIADGAKRLQAHVTPSGRPLVVLLEEQGADEPGNGGLIGEDADDVAAPLDLLVEPFERVGAAELSPVRGREAHISEHVRLGVVPSEQRVSAPAAWPGRRRGATASAPPRDRPRRRRCQSMRRRCGAGSSRHAPWRCA